MEFKDYYQTLGVPRTATADDIKKAFRKGVRKYHPDVSKEADATARMAALNEANDVLSDADRRAAYDALANRPQQPPPRAGDEFRAPPDWDAGFDFADLGGGSAGGASAGDHSEFFEQLFGRGARARRGGAAGGGFGSAAEAYSQRGADHHAKIELELTDAYTGAQRTLNLRSARLDAQGRVVSDDSQLEVTIPKGVHAGQHIRLAGRGEPGVGDAPPGDLLLEVAFAPDARWRAEGRDVYQRVPLAPWEAALGTTAAIETPGGTAEVTFPAGWKPGRKLRLKGRGIPHPRSADAGDLYLENEIVLPPADSDARRTAYAEMAGAFAGYTPRRAATATSGDQ